MLLNSNIDYSATGQYFKTENLTLDAGAIPSWRDTRIKEVKLAIINTTLLGKLQVMSMELMAPGYLIKDIRGANGALIFTPVANDLGLDVTSYRINTVDPQINLFGFAEGYSYQLQQTNLLRRV